jgi:hypothetical protein
MFFFLHTLLEKELCEYTKVERSGVQGSQMMGENVVCHPLSRVFGLEESTLRRVCV